MLGAFAYGHHCRSNLSSSQRHFTIKEHIDAEESMALGSHETPNKGATDTWLTPPEMIELLGPFDTDPCVPEGMP
jgi:hypothetical protein